MIPFSYNENRDAYATIRGFVYQVDITIDKWLDLSNNDKLYLECGEDIDEVKGGIRLLGQVKHKDKETFTLNTESFMETLSNFCKHLSDNPSLNLQSQYITNADIACEKTALFDDGKSKQRTKALDVWVEVGKTAILTLALQEKIEIIRKQVLKTVTNLCSKVATNSSNESTQKADSDKKNYQAFKDFLEKVTPNEWLAFIQAVKLDCGKTPAKDYSKRLQAKIQQKLPTVQAKTFYEQLFAFVFKKLTQKEAKMLDMQQLTYLVQQHQENRFEDGFNTVLEHIKWIFNGLSEIHSKADDIQKGTKSIKKSVRKLLDKDRISLDQAKSALNTDYNSIRNQKRTFAQLPNSHLLRQEVDKVIGLLQAPPLRNEPPAPIVIAGVAGMGKSVITTDLLDQLIQTGYCCLSLKCDLLDDVKDEATLRQRLNIKYDFFELFKTLNDNDLKVVVLIDQLDAVSESLLTDRSIASFYYDWINKLLEKPNVQVVVACRDYDLQKDDLLKRFNHGHNVVNVKALEVSEITQILDLIAIDFNSLKPALQKLLATPLHLDIFCSIAGNMDKVHWQDINSINNLYDKLWEQRIDTLKGGLAEKAKVVLHGLAQELFKNQKLVGSKKKYRNVNYPTIKALETNNLLIINDENIQFFHQTFFDYVFARSFVEDDNNSLTRVLRDKSKQNLFVRSSVRYVLAYLRDYDENLYCEEIETFLSQPTQFRFHLQLLAIEQLARLVDPNEEELQLVLKYILSNDIFIGVFSEYVNNVQWFKLLEGHFFAQLKGNTKDIGILWNVLPRVARQNRDVAFDFIEKVAQQKLLDEYQLTRLLERIELYDDERTFKVFDKYCNTEMDSNMEMPHFIRSVVKANPNWVAEKLWQHALKSLQQHKQKVKADFQNTRIHPEYFGHNYSVKAAWEKLVKEYPTEAYKLAKRTLYHFVFQNRVKRNYFYNDWAFYDFFIVMSREDDDQGNFLLFKIVKDSLIQQYQSGDKNWAKQEIAFFLRKNSVACIGLGLEIIDIIGNELADLFYKRLLQNDYLPQFQSETNSNIKYLTRLLLGRFFGSYTQEQQQQIVSRTVDFKITIIDKDYFKSEIKKGKTYLFYRNYETISVIPKTERDKHPILKRVYQEWHRKFDDIQNTKPRTHMLSAVACSIAPNSFSKLSFKALKESMSGIKPSEMRWFNKTQVNQEGHSEMFEQSVKDNYIHYLPFLLEILPDKTIPDIYKYKGLNAIIEICKNSNNLSLDEIVAKLYVLYANNEPIMPYKMYICWAASHLKHKTIEVFIFLETIALTKDDELNPSNQRIDKDLLQSGHNSLRGAAIDALFEYLEVENAVERVFQVCENIVLEEICELNVVILVHLGELYSYNAVRTVELFENLVTDKTPIEVVKHSIITLQYLIHYDFQRFIPILKRLLCENVQHLEHILVYAAFYYEYEGADELLDWAVQKQYPVVGRVIRYIAEDSKWQKAAIFIQKSFDYVKADEKKACASIILFAEAAHFDRWYLILKNMLQNYPNLAKKTNWVEYWLKCDVKNYYKECTELLGYFHKIASYENLVRHSSKGSFIELIDKIYKQAEFHNDKDSIQKILDIYDDLLKNPIIRGTEKLDILNDY